VVGPSKALVPWAYQNKSLWLALKPPLHFLSHFIITREFPTSHNFVSASSSVVPDTLINLLLNPTCCSQCTLQRSSSPSFKSFHPFAYLPLSHTIIAVQSNFNSLRTLWPQKFGRFVALHWCVLWMKQPCWMYENITMTRKVDRRFVLFILLCHFLRAVSIIFTHIKIALNAVLCLI
jgi:hypothetical protein